MHTSVFLKSFCLGSAALLMGPSAQGQSLESGGGDHQGWSEFSGGQIGGQIAMLNAQNGAGIADAMQAEGVDAPASERDLADWLLGAGVMAPLPVAQSLDKGGQGGRGAVFSFGPDLLILKPQSAESKVLAQIFAGQHPWPAAIPQELHQSLEQVYLNRELNPFWQAANGWRPGLDAALYQVAQARLDGLDGADYVLDAAYDYIAADSAADSAVARAEAELVISAVILPYAHDMLNGRYAKRPQIDVSAVMTSRMAGRSLPQFMAELIPAKVEYQRLRSHLAQLRAANQSALDIPQFSNGGHLRKGHDDPRVGELRHILSLTGDYTPNEAVELSQINVFDEGLHQAVIAFQARKGLSADGIVGGGTRRALNERPETPIALIKVNMERLRWETRMDDESDVYVRVNIPEYRLQVRNGGAVAMDMRAIVGRTDRRTPLMSDKIVNLKFSPDWTVPSTVYRNDILPSLQADPDYAARNGYSVIAGGSRVNAGNVDWTAPPRVTIYKGPSSNGPLGGVRFSLTNNIGIFLHDTNQKGYFNRSRRALSSGCVRVGDPAGLAHYLIQGEEDWTMDRVKAAMNRGRISWKELPNGGVPVYLSYMTVFVDEDGQMQTVRDVYREDRKLLAYFDDE